MRFIAGKNEADFTPVFEQKSRNSKRVARLSSGAIVQVEEPPAASPGQDGDDDHEWGFFVEEQSLGTGAEIRGWVEMKHISRPAAEDVPLFAVRDGTFVRTCARAEIATQGAGEDDSDTIVADFLLAWANIEAPKQEPGDPKYVNNPADFKGSDAAGPFRITTQAWRGYMEAVNKDVSIVSEFERLLPNSQVFGAAFLAQFYAEEFSKLATPTPMPADGPFIASYLNVLHCHLIGVGPAFHFHKLKDDGKGSELVNTALAGVIADAGQMENLLSDRAALFKVGDEFVTVEKFYSKTSVRLTEAFKTARASIIEHAEYLMPPKGLGGANAPWLAVAESEFEDWHSGGLTDTGGIGRAKAIEYLKSGDPSVNNRVAWCGGFVTFCLKGATPSFAATVVKAPLWAANWVNWGNTRLRPFQLRDIPRGALIVTFPLVAGASGHVAFFHSAIDGADKIALLGGNQSGKVTKSLHVHKNMIREIRWLDDSEASEGASDLMGALMGSTINVDDGPPISASEGDVLTLARTLYGEARGESRIGIEAVANVIMNRVRTKLRGTTVSEVCLARQQFSCWNLNDPNRAKIRNLQRNDNAESRLCFEIAEAAVRPGFPTHVTANTRHYFANYIRPPNWVRDSPNAHLTLREGVHIFYEGIA